MDLDEAKAGRRCAISLKWTRGSSPWRRYTSFIRDGKIERSVVDKAIKELGINPDKSNPVDFVNCLGNVRATETFDLGKANFGSPFLFLR